MTEMWNDLIFFWETKPKTCALPQGDPCWMTWPT